jgi:hypothetical protein
MSENTKNAFGSVSWDSDTSNGFKPRENTKDLYMRLEQGPNVVRVLTKPHQYTCHQWKVNPADPGFGNRVGSSRYFGADILEDKYGSKPKTRWLLYVIDRKTASVKLLDISRTIFESIKELNKDQDDWGDPTTYDINISVDKNGGASGYYKVTPKSKKPLSPADLELKQSMDLDLLKFKTQPPTVEQMNARVAALIAKSPNGLPNGSKAIEVKASVETQVQSSSNDENEDFDFPTVSA